MGQSTKYARFLQNEASKHIMNKYNKPFLTEAEYQKEIGNFHDIACAYHVIIRELKKADK